MVVVLLRGESALISGGKMLPASSHLPTSRTQREIAPWVTPNFPTREDCFMPENFTNRYAAIAFLCGSVNLALDLASADTSRVCRPADVAGLERARFSPLDRRLSFGLPVGFGVS